jgi:hypothetical protein
MKYKNILHVLKYHRLNQILIENDPYLNIVRSILEKQNYTFISTEYEAKINDLKRTKRYIIFKNN